jgi:hypothetical protein
MSIPGAQSAFIVSEPFEGRWAIGMMWMAPELTKEEAEQRLQEWDADMNIEGHLEDTHLIWLGRDHDERWMAIFRFSGGSAMDPKE